jgi:hypothetical protein
LKAKAQGKSSTEAELFGLHEVMSEIVWMRYFKLAQGIEISHNIIFQDNKSAMLLGENGDGSVSRPTRHINIHYFVLKDLIESIKIEIKFCHTENMMADVFTNPL